MSIYAMVWAYGQDVKNSGAKFTLITAAQYCIDGNTCVVKQETLAEDMSMGVSTVRKHLAYLEDEAQIIKRVERWRKDGSRAPDLIELVEFDMEAAKEAVKRSNRAAKGEITAQIEQDNRSNRAGNKRIEETLVNAPSNEGAVQSTSADSFVAYLAEQLENRTVPLDDTYKVRIGKDIKRALAKGMEEGVLWEWVDRIIERWDDYQLSLRQAATDVANGKTGSNGYSKEGGETPHPFSEAATSAKDKPRKVEWYLTFYPDAHEQAVEKMVKAGKGHSEIVSQLEGEA